MATSMIRLAAGIIAGTLVMTAGAAVAASAAPASPGTTAAPQPPSAAGRTVLLLNGDHVARLPGPAGRLVSTLEPAPHAGGVHALLLGAHQYYFPADALPFLGRGLSLSLFSLADLSRAEKDGRIPVTVTFDGRRPSLPGVMVTRAGSRTATGYLTSSSTRAFAAALGRQYDADRTRASFGTDGMFAHGTEIALTGVPASPAPARPGYPMHTLTVTGTSENGQPDTGDAVFVLDAADWRVFGDPLESANVFYHGTAKFSVPAGTYWAIGYFDSGQATRMDILPQFTVDGSTTTVHLAARAASSKVAMITPRPSAEQFYDNVVVRSGLHGTTPAVVDNAGFPVTFLSPTSVRPTVGTLQDYTQGSLKSPAGASGQPYSYHLALAGPPGIIPVQRSVISPATLATVRDRYYQARPGTGAVAGTAVTLAQSRFEIESADTPAELPGAQTEYVSAGPSVLWRSAYFSAGGAYAASQFGEQALRPGEQLTDSWGQFPLHPQPDVQLLSGAAGADQPAEPSAFRMGSQLVLLLNVFSDNQAGHVGGGPISRGLTGSYALYQNGRKIAHGNPFAGAPVGKVGGIDTPFGTSARVSLRPATLRLTLSAARHASLFRLSTSTITTWTWQTRPRPDARVPASWFCRTARVTFEREKQTRTCAVQPLMTLGYHVKGMDLEGMTPPGRQRMALDVGHLQLSGRAAIKNVYVQVSGNSGRSWHRAMVTGGKDGQYAVSFTAPARTDVTLRVSATDTAGGSITETIHDAYSVRS